MLNFFKNKYYIKILDNTESRFIIAGAVNTAFGVSLGYIFIKYLPFHYTFNLLLAMFLGVIFNYINSSVFVFRVQYSFKSILFFFLNYLFIYFLNIFLISVVISFAQFEEQNAFLIITPIGVAITYLVQKNLIFKNF